MRITWISSTRPVAPTLSGAAGSQREFKFDGHTPLAVAWTEQREIVDLGKERRRSARAFLDCSGQDAGVVLGGKVDGRVHLQRTARVVQFRRCVGIRSDRAVGHMKNISAQLDAIGN